LQLKSLLQYELKLHFDNPFGFYGETKSSNYQPSACRMREILCIEKFILHPSRRPLSGTGFIKYASLFLWEISSAQGH
ncbi:MAG: hypothetical protein ACXV2C_01805, partial [Candidatus Bathyarchaeia archaeon]